MMRRANAGLQGGPVAAGMRVSQDPDPFPGRQELRGAVARAVVDDDDLVAMPASGKRAIERVQRREHGGFLVEHRDDDGDTGWRGVVRDRSFGLRSASGHATPLYPE